MKIPKIGNIIIKPIIESEDNRR
ncbi:uncharacterized protein METZ01_LOCUS508942 [marine metagenome]|uniref:Uncharacterized protein n=1 Tax=marine metagenome TaxID=408172 RepID=A0A383EJ37_9ZZZZ